MSFAANQILFELPGYRAIELLADNVPTLQKFLEDNSEYFLLMEGCPPATNQAEDEFVSELPDEWGFTRKWAIGFIASDNRLAGFATVVSDLFARGVWNIGLFILSTGQHGQGVARQLYEGLEGWAAESGAKWLRLGVIEGNVRAERFWERSGFSEIRRRDGVATKSATTTVRVMTKAITGAELTEYLRLVDRDRPAAS